MSLSKFVEKPEVRALFDRHCLLPSWSIKDAMLAPPPAGAEAPSAAAWVGTAFDYLARWRIDQYGDPFDDDIERELHQHRWLTTDTPIAGGI